MRITRGPALAIGSLAVVALTAGCGAASTQANGPPARQPAPSASPKAAVALECAVIDMGASAGPETRIHVAAAGTAYDGPARVTFSDGSGDVFPPETILVSLPYMQTAWTPIPDADIGASAEPTSCTAIPGGTLAAAPATPVASPPAPVTTGPLGTTFTVATTDDSGNPVTYRVTLVKVDQHAALGPYETLDNPADHMAAVRFSITGVTGQASDDANSDADAIGADTTEYPSSDVSVADGPNFDDGTFEVGPGQTVSGWVSFEVPPGQTVASVQWSAGFDGTATTWTLAGRN